MGILYTLQSKWVGKNNNKMTFITINLRSMKLVFSQRALFDPIISLLPPLHWWRRVISALLIFSFLAMDVAKCMDPEREASSSASAFGPKGPSSNDLSASLLYGDGSSERRSVGRGNQPPPLGLQHAAPRGTKREDHHLLAGPAAKGKKKGKATKPATYGSVNGDVELSVVGALSSSARPPSPSQLGAPVPSDDSSARKLEEGKAEEEKAEEGPSSAPSSSFPKAKWTPWTRSEAERALEMQDPAPQTKKQKKSGETDSVPASQQGKRKCMPVENETFVAAGIILTATVIALVEAWNWTGILSSGLSEPLAILLSVVLVPLLLSAFLPSNIKGMQLIADPSSANELRYAKTKQKLSLWGEVGIYSGMYVLLELLLLWKDRHPLYSNLPVQIPFCAINSFFFVANAFFDNTYEQSSPKISISCESCESCLNSFHRLLKKSAFTLIYFDSTIITGLVCGFLSYSFLESFESIAKFSKLPAALAFFIGIFATVPHMWETLHTITPEALFPSAKLRKDPHVPLFHYRVLCFLSFILALVRATPPSRAFLGYALPGDTDQPFTNQTALNMTTFPHLSFRQAPFNHTTEEWDPSSPHSAVYGAFCAVVITCTAFMAYTFGTASMVQMYKSLSISYAWLKKKFSSFVPREVDPD